MVAILDLIFLNPQPRVQSVQQIKGDLLYKIMGDRESPNGQQTPDTGKPKKKKVVKDE